MIIGIKAEDGSIFGGGECVNLVRVAPLTTGSSMSTTGFKQRVSISPHQKYPSLTLGL